MPVRVGSRRRVAGSLSARTPFKNRKTILDCRRIASNTTKSFLDEDYETVDNEIRSTINLLWETLISECKKDKPDGVLLKELVNELGKGR